MGLTTNTMGSSKSFGFSRGRKKVLTTYTFPAGTSTWTAPAGVTSLTSAAGKGSNGTLSSWSDFQFLVQTRSQSATIPTSATNVGSTLSAATITSELNSLLSSANNFDSSGTSFIGTYFMRYTYYALSSTWGRAYFITSGTFRRVFTPYIIRNHPTTGDISTTANLLSTINGFQAFNSGTSGNATTGFSLNFPGGDGNNFPSTSTFNNVTVIPDTTYTINNNGSLIIEYYV